MNSEFPKISLVTVSFNQGQFLEETIKSVVEQNYPNLQYIIIDGGSTDNSVEIIKKYEQYIEYWVSEKDSGQSEAINKGIAKCDGEIFNWLCSDDYLEPGALLKVANAFKENDIHILYGNVSLFGGKYSIPQIAIGTQLQDNLSKTIVRSFITQPVTFWNFKYFLDSGLNNALHWYMDYEMWIKYLIKNGQDKVFHLNELIAHYRFHDNSKSQLESDYTQTNKSSKYKIEMNSIYYSMAKAIDNKTALNIIPSLSDDFFEYEFNFNLLPYKEIIEKALNYYVYDNAERYYWVNDYKFSKILFNNVNYNLLDEKERFNYNVYLKQIKKEPYFKYFRKLPFIKILSKIKGKSNDIKK